MLYTTHYMEEAESLCDRVVIIDHGRILAQGTLPELRSMLGERDLVRLSGAFQPDRVRQIFAGDGIEVVQAEETCCHAVPAGCFGTPAVDFRDARRRRAGNPRHQAHAAQPRKPVHQTHRQGTPGVAVRFFWLSMRKDLCRYRRDAAALALWFVLPLAITGMIGLVFGRGDPTPQDFC